MTLADIHRYLVANADLESEKDGIVVYFYQCRHIGVFRHAKPVDEPTYVNYIIRRMARLYGCPCAKMREKIEAFHGKKEKM